MIDTDESFALAAIDSAARRDLQEANPAQFSPLDRGLDLARVIAGRAADNGRARAEVVLPAFAVDEIIMLRCVATGLRPGDRVLAVGRSGGAEGIARSLLPRFTATRFEQPGFAQLHPLCPDGVAAGGEGGREMGALAGLGGPRRRANLEAAIADMLRVGHEVGLFPVT